MANSNDSQAGRKASAAAADDDAVFKVTPFGRQRKPARGRAILNRIVRFVGFPFFYVYEQMRSRKPSKAQKWSDQSGRHGAAPDPDAQIPRARK